MSERADDDVRGEQRKAARQLKQQQLQRGEASTAMATGAERRSLPSPEIMLGQPWSSWVDAVKLHGSDDSEESLKECGKNREAMRLCRDDMAIFGQCPAQDDFYLVQCSHCSQLVKPQAFQAHYERRHSSSSKPSSSLAPSAAYTMSTPPHRSRGSSGGGVSGGVAGRPSVGNSTSSSSSSSSSNSKTNKSAKEFSGHGRPPFFPKVPHDKILTPAAVKVEKVKVEPSANKMGHTPSSSSSSSSSSATVSSPVKPGLSCPSIPKPPTLAPGQIPNGKGHLSLPDKKQDHSASSKRPQYKRPLQEREFNPDIHCGVVDLPARKPCTRSLTCKTHSLSQRRAVPGRGKRFDTLLAEHKSKAREKELQHRSDLPQQTPPLRDPHPPPSSRLLQDPHQVSHGNGTADAAKPSLLSKPKPHNPGLPRLNSSNSHSGGSAQGDLGTSHEPPHHPAAAVDGQTRLSSDEGEAEEREDAPEKLDCHYSGYHPRPAAYCTFGSRLYGRSCHSFDRRWDRVRCAFSVMMDKHVNSQMWKKIPLALENSSAHRTSTNSLSSSASAAPRSVSPLHSGFRSPSPAPPAPPPPAYGQSHDSSSGGGGGGKPALSYGTTLNARSATAQGSAEHPAYGAQSRQVSSSPQMPSSHHPSLASGRPLKQPRTSGGSKSFRPKEAPSASLTHSTTNAASSNNSSSSGGGSSSITLGKKRKNSSLLMSYTTEASPSSSSSTSSSPFKRNCVVGSLGSTGSSIYALPASNPSSTTTSSSSSSSSSHTGVYTVGLNCTPGRTSGLSLRHEPPVRGPPSASPAESIKRMSVVMNSSDSTLSLGPFVHQGGDGGGSASGQQQQHGAFGHPDARLEGKKRKGSPATGPINSSSGGLSGGQGPGRPKVAKSPSVNNIHSKHARTITGTPGLSNNSLIHQPKARP